MRHLALPRWRRACYCPKGNHTRLGTMLVFVIGHPPHCIRRLHFLRGGMGISQADFMRLLDRALIGLLILVVLVLLGMEVVVAGGPRSPGPSGGGIVLTSDRP